MIAHYLLRQGVLSAIEEQVRFARRRFGRYEVIDFVAVLLGYAISGERTLEAFYERLLPFASPFMALFGRDRDGVITCMYCDQALDNGEVMGDGNSLLSIFSLSLSLVILSAARRSSALGAGSLGPSGLRGTPRWRRR